MLRRLRIGLRLTWIALSFGLPMTAALVYVVLRGVQKDVAFGARELDGTRYQRPLFELMVSLARPEEDGDAGTIMRLLETLEPIDAELGAALQTGDAALARRDRSEAGLAKLRAQAESLEGAAQGEARRAARRRLGENARTLFAHVGDTSNLILDPDLDSYYLMDATNLALPELVMRLQAAPRARARGGRGPSGRVRGAPRRDPAARPERSAAHRGRREDGPRRGRELLRRERLAPAAPAARARRVRAPRRGAGRGRARRGPVAGRRPRARRRDRRGPRRVGSALDHLGRRSSIGCSRSASTTTAAPAASRSPSPAAPPLWRRCSPRRSREASRAPWPKPRGARGGRRRATCAEGTAPPRSSWRRTRSPTSDAPSTRWATACAA